MRREDRKVVALLGFLHGVVHANILAIPVFLNFAWRDDFHADPLTLGLLFALGFGLYGVGAVPFGFLADRRSPGPLLVLSALGIGGSMAAIALSSSVPVLAVSLGALGFSSAIYHPTGLAVISRRVAEQGRAMGWHGMAGSRGVAAGQVASGRLAGRPRPERTLFALSLVGALLLLLLALFVSSSLSGALFGGAAIVFGLVLFSLEPLQNTLVTREAPRPLRGSAFGFAFLSVFGIGSIGAVLAGWLLQQNQDAVLFLVLGLCMAASGTAALGVQRKTG